MKHKHHIVPRHMGGSDDPSNLIELTVEEHAEAHKKLYEEHGRQQDLCAWKSLSGQIGKEEIQLLKSSMGGNGNKGKPKSATHKAKISAKRHEQVFTKETKNKISKSAVGNTNSKNHSTDAYKEVQRIAMKEAWARRKSREVEAG